MQILYAARLATIVLRAGTGSERAEQQPTHAHTLYCYGRHESGRRSGRGRLGQARLGSHERPKTSAGADLLLGSM